MKAAFEGYCGGCGKWGHRHRDCRSSAKASVSNVDEQWNDQGWWAADPAADAPNASVQAGQEAAEGWCTGVYEDLFNEENGWIFAVDELSGEKLVISNLANQTGGLMFDTSSGKTVDILSDSGSSVSACHPSHFPEAPLESGETKRYRTAQGKLLKFYGYKTVKFIKAGEVVRVRFTLLDVTRPIISVSSSMEQSEITTHYERDNAYMSKKTKSGGTKRLGLTYRVGLFFLRAVVAASAICPAE